LTRLVNQHGRAPSSGSQACFWSEEWQAAEREAGDDITAGRVRQFEDVEDRIARLESDGARGCDVRPGLNATTPRRSARESTLARLRL